MSYTVRYDGTKQEKYAKALRDAKDYVGEDRWDRIVILMALIITNETMRPRKKVFNCRFSLSFAGIQGLPATAIIKHVIRLLKK